MAMQSPQRRPAPWLPSRPRVQRWHERDRRPVFAHQAEAIPHAPGREGLRDARVDHGAVEWPRGEVGIATEALYALAHGLPKPKTIEQARENELSVSLRELRRVLGKTQVDVADEAGLTQGALSHFENATDHKLSALRKYISSLGGELKSRR